MMIHKSPFILIKEPSNHRDSVEIDQKDMKKIELVKKSKERKSSADGEFFSKRLNHVLSKKSKTNLYFMKFNQIFN